MPTVLAYINEGRVIADCPDCNGAEFVSRGKPFICSRCNPEIMGYKEITVQGYLVKVKDPEKVITALEKIISAGRSYDVIFPDDFEQIQAVLRERKRIVNMNWYPAGHPRMPNGETVFDLVIENLANGTPAPDGLEMEGK